MLGKRTPLDKPDMPLTRHAFLPNIQIQSSQALPDKPNPNLNPERQRQALTSSSSRPPTMPQQSAFTSLRLFAAWCLLACCWLPAQAKTHPEELTLRPKIDAAINHGVDSLFDRQFRDGSWGLHGDFTGGRGGLCLYTLLQCGVSRSHPAMRRAIAYCDGAEPTHTYATTCMIMALDALRDGRGLRIEELIDKLISWQRPQGDWAYPHGASDLSCTQYAALGLWIGHKRGMKIDTRVWHKLLESVESYRGEVEMLDNNIAEGRTGATKLESAGYSYRPSRDANQKPTGSMTSAAITIMEVCKAGLGRKMSRSKRNKVNDRIEAALRWLSHRFAVDKNPNGGHEYYYLYGLERIGALTKREQFGPHWWYTMGAKHLIATQDKTVGNWGSVNDTCFALLFLRRATSGHAPTTGVGGASKRHVFAVGNKDSDVRLRGAGQQPLSMWIDGFGKSLIDLHSNYGIRVISVEYLDAKGNVLAKIAGDPTKTWQTKPGQGETYLYRDKAMIRGEHKLHARVTLLANDAEPDATGPVQVINSEQMTVKIRDVFEGWMKTANTSYQDNLLRGKKVKLFASSAINEQNPGTHIIDGFDSKRWIASPDDKSPAITMSWRRAINVGSIMFAPPAQHDQELAQFDEFAAIEVLIGNDKDRWLRIPMGQDQLAPVTLKLPKPRKMRAIKIRFAGRVIKTNKIGLAEFSLLPPEKKKKR